MSFSLASVADRLRDPSPLTYAERRQILAALPPEFRFITVQDPPDNLARQRILALLQPDEHTARWETVLKKLRESCRICEEIIAHDARPACCTKPDDPEYVRRENSANIGAEPWRADLPPVDQQLHGSCDCPAAANEDCPFSEMECAARSFHHASLTVRSWFRKMRAADFERNYLKALALNGVGGVDVVQASFENGCWFANEWTLFDTQAVVERATRRTYLAELLRAHFREFSEPLLRLPEDRARQLREGSWEEEKPVAKIIAFTPEEMYQISRFVIWAATEDGARLEVVHSTAETQNEAEQQAEAWMALHPKGVAYVLKAIRIFTTDRGDPASPGARHAPTTNR